jgi:hypothetical protein
MQIPRAALIGRALQKLALAGAAITAACGVAHHPEDDTDAAIVDAAVDAAVDAPIDAPPPLPPGASASTSGGGVATSAGHRLQLRIGAPQPMGRAASTGHRLTTGPGALPWATP